MLDQGIIWHSISPSSSPVWVVPEKLDASNKQTKRVVNDRKLNEVTVDDECPLVTHFQYARSTRKMPIFVASGCHQIEIHLKDIQKTAFPVENGYYENVHALFGLYVQFRTRHG